MKRHTLNAEKRTIVGKKVRTLRREGLLPIGVYGHGMESIALQVKLDDFRKVYKEAGETGLVDIKLGNETYTCLIKNVQRHAVSNNVIHAEMHKVNLKEKITVKVTLVLVGESTAVTDQVGLILQTLNEVEVEALPTELPENIEVNVTGLKAVDDQITVADLPKVANTEVLTTGDEVVVKIVPAISEEVKKDEEAAAAETVAEEEETVENETETPEESKDKAPEAAEEKK